MSGEGGGGTAGSLFLSQGLRGIEGCILRRERGRGRGRGWDVSMHAWIRLLVPTRKAKRRIYPSRLRYDVVRLLNRVIRE